MYDHLKSIGLSAAQIRPLVPPSHTQLWEAFYPGTGPLTLAEVREFLESPALKSDLRMWTWARGLTAKVLRRAR